MTSSLPNLENIGFLSISPIQTKNQQIEFQKKDLPITKLFRTEVYLLLKESIEGKLTYKGVETLLCLDKMMIDWKRVLILYQSPTDFSVFSILILVLDEDGGIVKKILSNEFVITSEDQSIDEKNYFPTEFRWPEEIFIPQSLSGKDNDLIISCKDFTEVLGDDDPSFPSNSIETLIEKLNGKFEGYEKNYGKLENELNELKEKYGQLEKIHETDTTLIEQTLGAAEMLQTQNEELSLKLKKLEKKEKKHRKKLKKRKVEED